MHFASLEERQELATVYQKFKRGMVYVSRDIRLSLRIKLGGHSIEGAQSKATFHLEEAEGALRLYLPKDEVEQEICFESNLPRRVCQYLNIVDLRAPAIIGAVFRKDKSAVIKRILEDAGVSQVECDFAVLDQNVDKPDEESDNETLIEPTSDVRFTIRSPRLYNPSSGPRSTVRQSGSVAAEALRSEFVPNESDGDLQREMQDLAYERILQNVVDVARQRAESGILEATGLFAGAIEALSQETLREAFGIRTQERDFKVGAAGELYMFEFLKGLDLPEFGTQCWTSVIRDRVKIHPDYQDLEQWNGRNAIADIESPAIADIEYHDASGKLTQFLSLRGYLAQKLWDKQLPFYHIEVKTTVSDNWQKPFFMSKAQEKHVRNSYPMACDRSQIDRFEITVLKVVELR